MRTKRAWPPEHRLRGIRRSGRSVGGLFWVIAACAAIAASSLSAQGTLEDHELFERSVRPLLDQRCLSCHGEDGMGDLSLESRAGLLRGGASGPAIVLGDPDSSLLIQAVRHQLPKLKMPMTGGRLTQQQIADLSEWISRDAPWPGVGEVGSAAATASDTGFLVTQEQREFWSFLPLRTVVVPVVEDNEWAANPIDRFIKHRLDQEGLQPTGTTSKADLLRRASFNLVGLPPTPEAIETFVGSTSEDAYSEVVESLLASEHYGEQWGRHWLDVARFGEDDTRGLANDGSGRERYGQAFRYRDWVVDSINRDLSWPVFVKAQLAADLMPVPAGLSRQQLLPALGLLGGGPWYYDLAEPLTARADERHDRVDVTTRGFLGLTVACARCHNHKYDPIPTADYYALAGLFSNSEYHEYPIGSEEEVEAYEKDKEFRKLLSKALSLFRRQEAEQLRDRLIHDVSTYMMATWKVSGEPQLPVTKVANEERLDLELLERFVEFTQKEPKFYSNLVDWQTMIADGGEDEVQEKRAQVLADRFQRELLELAEAKRKLREHNEYLIANGSKPPRDRKSVPMPNGFESFFDEHQLELESLSREQTLLASDVFDYDVHNTTDYYNPEPGLLRFWSWSLDRQMSPQSLQHSQAQREQLKAFDEPDKQLQFVMGVRDLDQEAISDLPLHLRGSPSNLGAPVPRGFLTVLSDGTPARWQEGSGRLQFAESVASHPITARVVVNRIWRWHFGTGLVETPSNFGVMGERPSHPELLEFLASGFAENGYSMKWLHRLILSSRTYRLSSTELASDRVSSEALAANQKKDPENRFYWRANRRRLSAESIRDSLLTVAGTLDRTLGGPSTSLSSEDNVRRSLYGWVSRFQLDTYLQTFDFPNASLTSERRFVTNVPLQNLYFMNSDFVRRQAEALAKRLEQPDAKKDDVASVLPTGATFAADVAAPPTLPPASTAPSERARIERAYWLLFGRRAESTEVRRGLRFLERARSQAATGKDTAGAGAAAAGAVDTSAGSEEESPWVRYLRALMSTNEFRFVA